MHRHGGKQAPHVVQSTAERADEPSSARSDEARRACAIALRALPDRAKGPYTHGWVSHKLSGDQGVRLDELMALADIFGTTVSYLVGETDDEHRPVTYLDDPYLEPDDQMAIADMIAGRRLRRLQERQRRAQGIPDARGDS